MSTYSTVEKFKAAYPSHIEAIQCVFVSESGDVHQAIFTVDDWHNNIRHLMTQYVFINDWKSIIHTIKV